MNYDDIWCKDKMHDLHTYVSQASELWHEQCFTPATVENTEKIINLLIQLKEEIDPVIDDLSEVLNFQIKERQNQNDN